MSGWNGRRVTAARRAMAEWLPCPCAVCGRVVTADMAWDIGHTVARDVAPDLAWDSSLWRIEHAACNRRGGQAMTVAKARARKAAAQRAYTSRAWVGL